MSESPSSSPALDSAPTAPAAESTPLPPTPAPDGAHVVDGGNFGRWFPRTRWARVAFVLLALVTLAAVIALVGVRYSGMFSPWTADGDQPQAVWHYWRYHVDGAFPPGQMLTDYAFVMHAPPGWWLMMAPLSTVFEPLTSAKILNVIAFVLTHIVIYFAVARRSNPFVGLAAVCLLARAVDFSAIIAGGYARSFGPMLTLLFLGAFMAGKHRLVLVLLVVQAALYPSVVLPCGLVYGVYVVVKGPMRDRVRRMAGMFAAGLLIIAFGKSQDIAAPRWWGPLVTLEQAEEMPAWHKGGRVPELPLRPMSAQIEKNLERGFRLAGTAPLGSFASATTQLGLVGIFFAGVAVAPALWLARRRRGEALVDPFPWQVPALFLGALVSYFAARYFAFRLYLPYRPLQHVWPYLFFTGIPLLAWTYARNLIRREALATVVACTVAVLPIGLIFGFGDAPGPANYGSYVQHQKLYRFVREQPLNAVFAGEFAYVDKTPLFAHHSSYITKNLSHPFRRGYYNEAERRVRLMYGALYATKLEDVVAFADAEHVDFFIVRNKTFTVFDDKLFKPVKRDLAKLFTKNAKVGFALAKVPRSAVVYDDAGTRVISVTKLKEALKSPSTTEPTAPPSTAPEPADPAETESEAEQNDL